MNVSVAARELYVSQPSLSLAIKKLESEFSCILIVRNKVGFTLTPAGEELLKLAKGLLAHAEDVERLMHTATGDAPTVTVGIPPMAGALLLPEMLGYLKENSPSVKLSTREGGREELLRFMDGHLVDLAILPHEGAVPQGCLAVPIKEYETVCCVSNRHPLADRGRVTPADLSDEDIVLFSDGYFQNERLRERFDRAGVPLASAHRFTQLSTIEKIVADNIAVGFLFADLARQIPGIRTLSLDPPIYTQISLVWMKERRLTAAAEHFVSLMERLYSNVAP